jgi:hypothetical protein
MKKISLARGSATILGALALVAVFSSPAYALDAYQDRRGFFTGIGMGGGGAFQDGKPGGALLFDFQLGGGATKNLTLDLDTDLWIQIMDGYKNILLTPGPEVNYFFGDTGLFVRGGIGMALTFIRIEDPPEGADDSDFKIGFDGSVGFGWEFFAGSDLAAGLAVVSDYVILDGDDIISVNFAIGLKYY